MTRIFLNGDEQEVPSGLTVTLLLHHLGMSGRPLLVELEGKALIRSEWAETVVQANDRIELVQIVAGG